MVWGKRQMHKKNAQRVKTKKTLWFPKLILLTPNAKRETFFGTVNCSRFDLGKNRKYEIEQIHCKNAVTFRKNKKRCLLFVTNACGVKKKQCKWFTKIWNVEQITRRCPKRNNPILRHSERDKRPFKNKNRNDHVLQRRKTFF